MVMRKCRTINTCSSEVHAVCYYGALLFYSRKNDINADIWRPLQKNEKRNESILKEKEISGRQELMWIFREEEVGSCTRGSLLRIWEPGFVADVQLPCYQHVHETSMLEPILQKWRKCDGRDDGSMIAFETLNDTHWRRILARQLDASKVAIREKKRSIILQSPCRANRRKV